MRLVNLFVIGAMKSGSTTLHEILNRNPDIYMSTEKEPGFFVPEIWKSRRPEEYYSLFCQAGNAMYCGESSTHYTKIPTYEGVPNRIHDYNGNARIIYIMRDPIKRLISHYHHAVRDLYFYGETRSILRAIREDPMYIAYSDYSMQIKPYIELFGTKHVYTLTLEQLIAAPNKTVKAIFNWLSVTPDIDLDNTITANKAPLIYTRAKGTGYLNRFRYSGVWEAFYRLVPKPIRQLCVRLAETKAEGIAISEKEITELKDHLIPIFQKKMNELRVITGREYNEWKL